MTTVEIVEDVAYRVAVAPQPLTLFQKWSAHTGMQQGDITKYRPFPQIDLPNRQWPSRTINTAPIWCSVDLRVGNQALAIPMSVDEKVEMFQLLEDIGFKEIEVGFPSASQIEYDFLRRLVNEDRIPDDVTVQVLVQAREELIRRTFESLRGTKKAILHLYNSTSPAQRKIVFGMSKQEIVDIAVNATRLVKQLRPTLPAQICAFSTRRKASRLRSWSLPWKYARRLLMNGNPPRENPSSLTCRLRLS